MKECKVSDNDIGEIIEKYLSGISPSKLGAEYGVTGTTIRNYLIRNDIQTRSNGILIIDSLLYKMCRKCNNVLEVSKFHKSNIRASGFDPWCKRCKCKDGINRKRKRIKDNLCSRCGNKKSNSSFMCEECLRKASSYKNLERERKWERFKRENDIQYRIAKALRNRFRSALKSQYKKGSAVRDLGCSIAEFIIYIENQFSPGMTWDNYGRGRDKWNIDHIIPLMSVDLTDRENVIMVCHYTNLRPLWQSDNIKRMYTEGYR